MIIRMSTVMIIIIARKSHDSKNEKYSDDNDNYDSKETEEQKRKR